MLRASKLRRGTTWMLFDNLPGQEHVRQRERRSLTTQPQKCSLLPTLRESFHETKVKRGDRGTIKFRGGIFEKVRAPRPPLLEIYSSLFHFGGAMREPGGGASSPKEFQEFSSPRTEGNSSRGLDHFVLRSFYFPFLLLVFSAASRARHARNHRPETRSSRGKFSRGLNREPRILALYENEQFFPLLLLLLFPKERLSFLICRATCPIH